MRLRLGGDLPAVAARQKALGIDVERRLKTMVAIKATSTVRGCAIAAQACVVVAA